MESWCFDSINGSNNMLMEWDFKVPFTYENSVENPSFPEVTKNEATVKDIVSPSSMVISSLVSEEESVVDSNSRESSLVDVKLGGVSDNVANNSSKGAPSSSESSNRVKRVRRTGFSSQAVCCQVHGCNKDLSSAKEYHRRHKVCDAHSKTSKVIVSGIEQRFCQQCSRFHLLGEFDDGKRSCRKRLAGHNQRRRKPQVGCNGRAGRSFSYTGSVGSKFPGTTLTSTCFIYQDILPRGASHADKYGTNVWAPHVKIEDETNGWSPQVKIEDGADYSQKSNYIDGQFPERSDVPAFPVGKLHCSTDNVSDNRTQSEIVSRSLVQMNSLVSKDLTPFDEASTVQGLAGISESGCALSLLSSQSQNYKSTDLSSGMLGAHTYVIPNRSTHYNVAEVSEKLLRVGSRSLTSGDEEEYYSLERSNQSAMPVLSNGNVILQDSEFVNDKNPQLCEEESTIDLFRLSSQLHRVENQRQSATSEQELESFWS